MRWPPLARKGATLERHHAGLAPGQRQFPDEQAAEDEVGLTDTKQDQGKEIHPLLDGGQGRPRARHEAPNADTQEETGERRHDDVPTGANDVGQPCKDPERPQNAQHRQQPVNSQRPGGSGAHRQEGPDHQQGRTVAKRRLREGLLA